MVDPTGTVLCFDSFLSEVNTPDNHGLTIDELITREDVERPTHEEVIVGCGGHGKAITEQIVLSAVEIGHEGVRIEGEEVDFTCFHSIDIQREDDTTLPSLGANQVALLEGIWLSVFIQFVVFPQDTVFHFDVISILFNSSSENSNLSQNAIRCLARDDRLRFEVEFDNTICFHNDGRTIRRVE